MIAVTEVPRPSLSQFSPATDYDHNPPLHVLAILVAFLSMYHLVDWLWVPLKGIFGWFLIPIGGAALYVYIVHSVIVYYVLLSFPAFKGWTARRSGS